MQKITDEAEKNTQGTALQTLIAALNENVTTLADRMHLESDAVIVNQCNEDAVSQYQYDRYTIRCYHKNEHGVGRSRNEALDRADAELCLFSDEDIVYRAGYADTVCRAFAAHPRADLLLFNVRQSAGRETYHISSYGRVRWYNYGRYPAYAIAARTRRLQEAGVRFSLLFGGGARYMNGEDSLFLHDCLEKGLRIFHTPELLGEERERESTWFHGYGERFFFDRGVLYRHLYGRMAYPCGLRFLLLHRGEMCREMPFAKCLSLLREGIAHADLLGADAPDGEPRVSDDK